MYIDGTWIYVLIVVAAKKIGPKAVYKILTRYKFITAMLFLLIAALGTAVGIQSWKRHKAELKARELELKQEVERIVVKGFLPEPESIPENYMEVLS